MVPDITVNTIPVLTIKVAGLPNPDIKRQLAGKPLGYSNKKAINPGFPGEPVPGKLTFPNAGGKTLKKPLFPNWDP